MKRLSIPILIPILVLPLFAQQQTSSSKSERKSLSYSVEVGLAQISLRVTDENNKWVSGLKNTDLELLEDGVPQEIVYCDEIRPEVEGEQSIEFTVPDQEISPVPSPRMSNNILFVFDESGSSMMSVQKHKEYVREFSRQLQTTDTLFTVVVIKTSGNLEIFQDFTNDMTKISQALEKLRGGTGGIEDRINKSARISDPGEMEACAAQLGQAQTYCQEGALRIVVDKAMSFAAEERHRTAHVVRSLESFVKMLRHVPGHKNLVFISEGLDPSGAFFLNQAASTIDHFIFRFNLNPLKRQIIEQAKAEANRIGAQAEVLGNLGRLASSSDTALYWVNPVHGKRAGGNSADIGHINAFEFKYFNAPDMETALRGIAEDTGGQAVTSSDLKKFYGWLAETIPRYYVVSYKPSRPINDGKFHRIEIRTRNAKYKLAYKKEMKDLSPQDRLANKIAELMDFSGSPDFPLLSQVNYFKKSEEEYRMVIQMGVSYDQIEPKIDQDHVQDDIHFSYVVRDGDGKVYCNQDSVFRVNLNLSKFESMQENNGVLEYLQSCSVKPGQYSVSLAAVDTAASKTSSNRINVDLPGKAAACLSLSPVLLASNSTKSESVVTTPTSNEKGEILYGDQAYQFSLTRVFPSQGSLRGFYQIYNANIPSVLLSFKLYRDQNVFINQTSEHEISAYTDPHLKIISNFFSVPYKNLAPGSYQLEIALRESKNQCSTSARVSFEIAPENLGS